MKLYYNLTECVRQQLNSVILPSLVFRKLYKMIVKFGVYSTFAGKHLVLVTDIEKADPEFAFDNPGFRGEFRTNLYLLQ